MIMFSKAKTSDFPEILEKTGAKEAK